MATYVEKSVKMVSCPYDPTHRLLESRLQAHIAKCQRNHPDIILEHCSFNAQHVVKKQDLTFHLLNCPDRSVLDKQMSRGIYETNHLKGRTAVPSYMASVPITCSENWDNEIDHSGSAGYIPKGPVLPDGIIQDLGMMKKAERKKVYQDPSSVISEAEKQTQEKPTPKHETIRQPTLNSQNLSAAIKAVNAGSVQPSPSGKIAANIFGTDTSYFSHAAALNNIGIGRGRGILKSFKENDFPPLGR